MAVAVAAAALPTLAGGTEPAAAGSPLLQLVQFGDRGPAGSRGSLFDRPSLTQPQSLFRPRSFRLGPHYEPPAVIYEPPPVIYEPPTVTGRPSVRDSSPRGRCAPRTRAWYRSCAARFRSFDSNRGTYTTYSGEERPCRCP